MLNEPLLRPPIGGLAILVLVLGAALLLREVSDLVVQLLVGGLLALVAWPMVGALRRVHIPASLALALTTLVVVGLVVGGCAIILVSIGELVTLIPTYEDRLTGVVESARILLADLRISTNPDALLAVVRPDEVASQVGSVASSISSAGVAMLVVALTMIYALAGASSLRARAERLFGRDHALLAGVTRFADEVRTYLVVRAQLGLFAAVFAFLLLVAVGVPVPALWAALVFAASFIPNVGALVALIPPTILALLGSGVAAAAAVVLGFGLINFIQDNFLQPMALGAKLNLTALVGFVAVIVWAWIFGAAGALLAVPLTVALVEILEAFPSTRAVAALMRNETIGDAGLARDRAGAAAKA